MSNAKTPVRRASRDGGMNAVQAAKLNGVHIITVPIRLQLDFEIEVRQKPAERAERHHRYAVIVRHDTARTWEVLVVDAGGDSGGWLVASRFTFRDAMQIAQHVVRDETHAAFGAPIEVDDTPPEGVCK